MKRVRNMTLNSTLDIAAEETAPDSIADEDWRSALDLCGDLIRDDVPEPKPGRLHRDAGLRPQLTV